MTIMKHVSIKFLVSVSAIAITASIAPHPVKAQSSADQSAGLEEITVTARKRAETLLEVPVAVSAFDSQMIQQEGIETLNDIASLTPGFNIDNQGTMTSENNRETQSLIIRGMTPGQSPTASVFIDGAPITSGFVEGIGSLDRVEVLKGPQSAYFGRETFAGAINLVTKKPSDDFKIGVDALYGSDQWHDIKVTAEGAIVPGILSVRASIRDYEIQGQYTNYGSGGGLLGDQSTKSSTLAIYSTPTDNLTVKLFGEYWHDSDGVGATGLLLNYNCKTPTSTNGQANYFCGQVPQVNLRTVAADTLLDYITRDAVVNGTTPTGAALGRSDFGPSQTTNEGGLRRDAFHAHGDISYEIPDWGITITSLSAANMDHFSNIQDLDNQASTGIPNPYYGFLGPVAQQQQEKYTNWLFAGEFIQDDVSQEFRITSDQAERFRWTVGADYAHAVTATSLYDNTPFGSASLENPTPIYTDTYSVFGSLSYDVLDNLTVSFDARYQLDHQATFTENPTGPDTFVASGNFHSFMPRVIVQYKIDPDVMVYASWSKGANVGLLNTALTSLPGPTLAAVTKNFGVTEDVAPEETEQYEVGIKGKFWDGRINIATDIYAGTWTKQIASVPIFYVLPGTTETTETDAYINIGKTDLFGWEFDGAIKPIDHLVINGAAGFAGTTIKNYTCTICLTVSGSTVATGNQLPDYPAWQANVGAEWSDDVPMVEGLSYYLRGEVVYRSLMFADYSNYAWDPSSTKFNFRVGLKGQNYSGEFFVLNAFDDKSYSSAMQNVNLLSPGFSALAIPVGLPVLRQFGVRVKYSFGGTHDEAPPATAYVPPPVVAPKPASTARSYQVFFDFNKSDLTPQAVTIVDTAAKNAGPAKVTEIEVTGHTDTVGSDAYNMRLSRRRAESVAAELEKMGIPSSEIAIFAKGKKDLLVPTADGVKEPQNRRVQIVYAGGPTS
jgi:iron complex outermembrane receptor protein